MNLLPAQFLPKQKILLIVGSVLLAFLFAAAAVSNPTPGASNTLNWYSSLFDSNVKAVL
jgi:hypothetical protein